jgi:hypothetical protein
MLSHTAIELLSLGVLLVALGSFIGLSKVLVRHHLEQRCKD